GPAVAVAVEGPGGGTGEPVGVFHVVGGGALAGEADEVGGLALAVEGVAVDVVFLDDDGVEAVGFFAEVAYGGGGGGGGVGPELDKLPAGAGVGFVVVELAVA